MLFSLAIIFLLGMILGSIFKKMHLPSLLGMLITGIVLGPYALNILSPDLLAISGDLRKIALIIILTRAGLNLDIQDLKKVGRPAILMCFIPALFEISGTMILAPKLFHISLIEAGILGTVIAAVSPAVIVPKMLKIMNEGYGIKKSIPQMILAGASVDDIFVIVLFSIFINLAKGVKISLLTLASIPISIVTGLATGFIIGVLLYKFFQNYHIRDSAKVLIILSISFLLVTLEEHISSFIPFSGLLGIMTIGGTIQKYKSELSQRLALKYSKLWVAAEICLFVLVGATVNLNYAINAGTDALFLLIFVLLFRIIGVLLCVAKTSLNNKEKIFTMISCTPKATVQAAIGSIPLALGLACGDTVLTVAVLSILITAPLGALAIDLSYKKLLSE
ncbi:cation:proton antiporter [Fusobacterium sp.]|uniref:cation:proton antiporter n=1 Tax=Fusobacterium sp. TaxID=68766 RepID=UPI00396C6D5C